VTTQPSRTVVLESLEKAPPLPNELVMWLSAITQFVRWFTEVAKDMAPPTMPAAVLSLITVPTMFSVPLEVRSAPPLNDWFPGGDELEVFGWRGLLSSRRPPLSISWKKVCVPARVLSATWQPHRVREPRFSMPPPPKAVLLGSWLMAVLS